MPSATGAILAELKTRTGLTWAQLAQTIGASSGDYVRKVASGARPGRNLDTAVADLMATGRVHEAPARRRAASGELARVRASRSTGAPSRIPEQQAPQGVAPRELFRMSGGRLGWSQGIAADNAEAIRAAIRSAGQGRHRVAFRVTFTDANGHKRVVTLGQKGGYKPRTVLDEMDDPADWLAAEVGARGGYGVGDLEGADLAWIEVVAE